MSESPIYQDCQPKLATMDLLQKVTEYEDESNGRIEGYKAHVVHQLEGSAIISPGRMTTKGNNRFQALNH